MKNVVKNAVKKALLWLWIIQMVSFAAPSYGAAETESRGYFGFASRAEPAPQGGQGLRLVEILDRGPADQAGLQTGDRIVAIDGEPITFLTDLEASRGLARFRSGDKLRLTVLRDGRKIEAEMTLTEIPAATLKRIQAWEKRAAQACEGAALENAATGEPKAVPQAGELVRNPEGGIETLLTMEGTALLDLISNHPDRRARVVLGKPVGEPPTARLELNSQRPVTVAIDSLPPTIQAAAADLTAGQQAEFLIEFQGADSKGFRVHRQSPQATDQP